MTDRLYEWVEDLPGEWTDTYWSPPRALDFDEYDQIFRRVRSLRNRAEQELSTLLWWLSDVLNNGEMDVGQEFAQLLTGVMLSKESLIKVRRMGEEFPAENRWHPAQVPYWIHWEVVRIKHHPEKRAELLKKYAEDEDYSRDDLRADVRAYLEENDPQGQLDVGDGSNLPACPLCEGKGKITHDRREAYLMEEGVRV